MCLYPKLITNPKYKKNQKNGGVIPAIKDKRATQVPIGCQKCMECKKQKAREWTVRLEEEIKINKNGKFVTFTFSDESLVKLGKEINSKYEGYDRDNAIATLGIRKFLERWRYHHKKSLRHWITSELGQESTERIHLHGIIWTDQPKAEILKVWQYGNMGYEKTWAEEKNYVNGETIGYTVKYVDKIDEKHPNYKAIILTSSGIGNKYIDGQIKKIHKYDKTETREEYTNSKGYKQALPIYYRNKLWTDEEREQLWMQKLDQEKRYVNGVEIDVSKGYEKYYKALAQAQRENKALGYGTDEKNWEQEQYEKQLRNAKQEDRYQKVHNNGTNKNDIQKRKNPAINGKHKPKQTRRNNVGAAGYEEEIKRIARELGMDSDNLQEIK